MSQKDLNPVVITEASLFPEKASLFPGCVFVIGGDTFERLWDEKYYDRLGGVMDAFRLIEDNDCSFLVVARRVGRHIAKFDKELVPLEFLFMFKEVNEYEYTGSMSSSGIRHLY